MALEAGVKVESDGAVSIASEDSKRKRRESVVTSLSAMAAKRNKGHASQQCHAAWLRDLNEPEAPSRESGGFKKGEEAVVAEVIYTAADSGRARGWR